MKKFFLLSFIVTCVSYAGDVSPQQIIQTEVKKSIEEDSLFEFSTTQYYNTGQGLRCAKKLILTASLEGDLRGLRVKTDEDLNTRVDLLVEDIVISLDAKRKGGILCNWHPLGGKIYINRLFSSIDLLRSETEYTPDIDIKKMSLQDLQFRNFYYEVPGAFRFEGSAPDWFHKFLDKRINGWLQKFLYSSLGKRLDNYLTDELRRRLEEIDTGDDEPVPEGDLISL